MEMGYLQNSPSLCYVYRFSFHQSLCGFTAHVCIDTTTRNTYVSTSLRTLNSIKVNYVVARTTCVPQMQGTTDMKLFRKINLLHRQCVVSSMRDDKEIYTGRLTYLSIHHRCNETLTFRVMTDLLDTT